MVLCVEMDVSMTNKADFKLLITRFPLTPLRTQDDQMYPVWPFHIEPFAAISCESRPYRRGTLSVSWTFWLINPRKQRSLESQRVIVELYCVFPHRFNLFDEDICSMKHVTFSRCIIKKIRRLCGVLAGLAHIQPTFYCPCKKLLRCPNSSIVIFNVFTFVKRNISIMFVLFLV